MNRDNRVWNIICLITALSIFFVVMAEARPDYVSRPLIRRKHLHVLTERQHIPDLAFFWKINQKLSHSPHTLSNEQQYQLKKAFWNLYVQTVAVQEEASDDASVLPKETARSTQMGLVFADYLKTLDGIFTRGQQSQRRKHFPRVKSPGQFLVVTNFRTHLVTSGVLAEVKHTRAQSYITEETTNATQQYTWAALAQVSLPTSLERDLSQLQTLRL